MKIIRKTSKPFAVGASSEEGAVAVIIEPKPGCTVAELTAAAGACAAREVEWLTERMLSAVVERSVLPRLSAIAHVSIKPRKVPHAA